MGFGNLATRVRGDPDAIVSQLRAVVRSLDPDVPLSAIQTVESILYDSVAAPRFRTQLLVGFAGVALILAVVGLYGMLAYSVTQRSREMGIRMALGARPTAVFRMVVRQGMMLVVVGIVLGVIGAIAATRLLAAQLFAVTPRDPAVFVVVATALTMAGLAACIVPARRATKADPIAALRLE